MQLSNFLVRYETEKLLTIIPPTAYDEHGHKFNLTMVCNDGEMTMCYYSRLLNCSHEKLGEVSGTELKYLVIDMIDNLCEKKLSPVTDAVAKLLRSASGQIGVEDEKQYCKIKTQTSNNVETVATDVA